MTSDEKIMTTSEDAAAEVLARQQARALKVHASQIDALQQKNDEEVRANHARHQAQTEASGKVLAKVTSATGNAFARQGLNQQDVDRAVALVRAGTDWEAVKKAMGSISAGFFDAWRPELERLAALPPGGERVKLSMPTAPVAPGSFIAAELARGDTLPKE